MAPDDSPHTDRTALRQSFEAELERLAEAAAGRSLVDGVMRLRALSEIAAALGTAALLELAVRLETQAGNDEA